MGNEFVTSVGLKKGLFDSEKVMIGPGKEPIDPEKGSFGDEKVSIGSEEVAVETEKVSIDQIIASLDVAQPTRVNLKKLWGAIAEMQVFGRSEVMRITEVESTRAGQLLAEVSFGSPRKIEKGASAGVARRGCPSGGLSPNRDRLQSVGQE